MMPLPPLRGQLPDEENGSDSDNDGSNLNNEDDYKYNGNDSSSSSSYDDDDFHTTAADNESFHSTFQDHLFSPVAPISVPGGRRKQKVSLNQYLERGGINDAAAPAVDPYPQYEYEYDHDHERRRDGLFVDSDDSVFAPRTTLWDHIVRTSAIVLLGCAIAASYLVADSCEFLSIHGDDSTSNNLLPHPLDNVPGQLTVYVGIFGYAPEDDEYCEPYLAMFQSPTLSGTTHDGSWNIFFILSQWCAVSAPVCAGCAFLLLWFSCWIRTVATKCPDNFRLASILCIMACIFQMGTFFEYMQKGLCYDNDDRDCHLEFFGYLSIITSLVYGLCGAALLMVMNEDVKEQLEKCIESMLPASHSFRQRRNRNKRDRTKQALRSSFSSDVVSISSLDSMDSKDFELFQKKFFGSNLLGNKTNKNNTNKRGNSPPTGRNTSTRLFGASNHSNTADTTSLPMAEKSLRNPSSSARLQRAAERRKRTSFKIRTLEENAMSDANNNAAMSHSTHEQPDYQWKSAGGVNMTAGSVTSSSRSVRRSIHERIADMESNDAATFATAEQEEDHQRQHRSQRRQRNSLRGQRATVASQPTETNFNDEFHDEIYHSDDNDS